MNNNGINFLYFLVIYLANSRLQFLPTQSHGGLNVYKGKYAIDHAWCTSQSLIYEIKSENWQFLSSLKAIHKPLLPIFWSFPIFSNCTNVFKGNMCDSFKRFWYQITCQISKQYKNFILDKRVMIQTW